jgi:hypothetical protein
MAEKKHVSNGKVPPFRKLGLGVIFNFKHAKLERERIVL